MVSQLIAREVEKGAYTNLRDEALDNYTYGLCPDSRLGDKAEKQFGLDDFGAVLVFLAFSSLIALVMTRLGVRAKKSSDVLKASIDEDGDGHVSSAEMRHYLARHTSRRFSTRTNLNSNSRVLPPYRRTSAATRARTCAALDSRAPPEVGVPAGSDKAMPAEGEADAVQPYS